MATARRTKIKTMTGEIEHETDRVQHLRALAVAEELHRHGFSRVWIESVKMFRGGLSEGGRASDQVQHEVMRVVIDEQDIHADRLQSVFDVANEQSATVHLAEIKMTSGQSFSRIAIWPGRG